VLRGDTHEFRRPSRMVKSNRLLEVLEPRGYGVIEVPGDGDLRLALGACEMVLSGEEPGWQVWFEGDVEGTIQMRLWARWPASWNRSLRPRPRGLALADRRACTNVQDRRAINVPLAAVNGGSPGALAASTSRRSPG
jgi:hypothetical protein